MKKDLLELIFVLDRSGSMSGLEKDTIGGFNSMMEKQKTENGEVLVTTVLFDNRIELLHDRMDIRALAPLTEKDYFVRGSTALLDALGSTITRVGRNHHRMAEDYRPEKTMFVIITDGYENASREYSRSKVRELIEHEKNKYGWEFLFLGANIDAVATAETMGIGGDYSVDFHADEKGVALNYRVLSEAVSQVRTCAAPLGRKWKKAIEEDYESR